ncbi:MAG: hypothetical protein AAB515_00625 [Patescibacteria group bacterium]
MAVDQKFIQSAVYRLHYKGNPVTGSSHDKGVTKACIALTVPPYTLWVDITTMNASDFAPPVYQRRVTHPAESQSQA